MAEYTLVLDIGGTKILGAAVSAETLADEQAQIAFRQKNPTFVGKGKEKVFEQITKTVDTLIETVMASEKKAVIACMSLGIPGLIEDGVILFAPNLPLQQFPIRDELQNKYKIPVFVGNDATLSMLGEWKYGVAKDLDHVIGFFVGTGIGGGLVLNGKIYEGAFQAGSELGHMIVNPEGAFCGCGAKGCLESVASKTGMLKEIKKQIKRGRETYLKKFFDKDFDILKSSMLKEAIENQDALAQEIIDQSSKYLGIAAASLLNVLNPEMVIFGGGILSSLGEIMLPVIVQTAQKYAIQKNFNSARLVLTALKDDACLMGAFAAVAVAKAGETLKK